MKRAIGIVRVSQTRGRNGDTFHSPEIQRERIEGYCKGAGLALLPFGDPELDVSGGLPLEQRPALGPAVVAIEEGHAEVIVVYKQDRLDRSLTTRSEVIRRVEAAGGLVVTSDGEVLSHATADKWAQATLGGFMGEYQRRIIRDKTKEAQARALEAGRWPLILIPGLRPSVVSADKRGESVYGLPELDPDTHEAVTEAFRMRSRGVPLLAVRSHLRAGGIDRSYHGTCTLLASRQAIGELRFGEHFMQLPEPHLIDVATFERVQKMVISRGRKPKSDRLLARLGVVRCGNCGARMVVGTVRDGRYPFYRCPPTGDCTRRVTISAAIVEKMVWQRVEDRTIDMQGVASAQKEEAAKAVAEAEHDQAALDGAIKGFGRAGVATEPSSIERIEELRQARDRSRDVADRALSDLDAIEQAAGARDASLEGKRNLIVALIEQVLITSEGRGEQRVHIDERLA